MEVTIRQLRYLIALAGHGHFGRAAAAVNVSQPALSVQIRTLEEVLGVDLVERGGRRIRLTPAGREVLRRAQRIMDEMGELTQAARWARGLGGRLRVGVIPTVAPYLLPVALPLLRGHDLGLDLGVREAQTRDLIEDLRAGTLDAAVVALPLEGRDLVAAPLFEDRFLLAGSAQGLAAMPMLARPDAMEAGRLLLLDDGHCLADQALAACAMPREETRVDMRASSLSTLCGLVAEGFGLTFLPELAVRVESAAAPRLALRRFAEPEPRRRIGLARRRLSADDGWFSELAGLLASAGRTEIDRARAAVPFRTAEIAEASTTG